MGLVDEAVQIVGLECRESIAAKLTEQNYLSRRNTRIYDGKAPDRLEVSSVSKTQRQRPAQANSVINSASSSSHKVVRPCDEEGVMQKVGELEYDIS